MNIGENLLVSISTGIGTPRIKYSTYITIELQEHLKVDIVPESRVGCQPLQEHFMHSHSLLEGRQVLSVTHVYIHNYTAVTRTVCAHH